MSSSVVAATKFYAHVQDLASAYVGPCSSEAEAYRAAALFDGDAKLIGIVSELPAGAFVIPSSVADLLKAEKHVIKCVPVWATSEDDPRCLFVDATRRGKMGFTVRIRKYAKLFDSAEQAQQAAAKFRPSVPGTRFVVVPA